MVFYAVINDTGENFISGEEKALIAKFPGQTVYRCELPSGACVNTQDLWDIINRQLVVDWEALRDVKLMRNKQNKRNEKVD